MWFWSKIWSRVKISHYIEPSNPFSALVLIERINGCVLRKVGAYMLYANLVMFFFFFFFCKRHFVRRIYTLNLLECPKISFFFPVISILCRYIGSTIETYTPGWDSFWGIIYIFYSNLERISSHCDLEVDFCTHKIHKNT